MHGAGGTDGGVGRFIIGFIMFVSGVYLFLTHVSVTSGMMRGGFGFGSAVYSGSLGGLAINVTGGMILLPFMLGVGMVFWNSKNVFGWLLAGGSLLALTVGIIASVRMTLLPMTAFDLIMILVLVAGGGALFFSSLKNFSE